MNILLKYCISTLGTLLKYLCLISSICFGNEPIKPHEISGDTNAHTSVMTHFLF